jgi:hypothetical protein
MIFQFAYFENVNEKHQKSSRAHPRFSFRVTYRNRYRPMNESFESDIDEIKRNNERTKSELELKTREARKELEETLIELDGMYERTALEFSEMDQVKERLLESVGKMRAIDDDRREDVVDDEDLRIAELERKLRMEIMKREELETEKRRLDG